MLIFKFSFGPLQTNAILLGCPRTGQAAAIDPSLGSTGAILERAQELNLNITKILLTHSHWDHFGDAYELKTKTGAPLYVHPLDAKNLEEPGSDGVPLYFPIHPVIPDRLFNDADVIGVGNLELKVIHTPGHCPGSVCFYLEAEQLLISGDTLFKGGMGTLALPTAEPEKMWKSLQKLSMLPPNTRVVPGHGPDTRIGNEDNILKRSSYGSSW